jgi:hypothetical protein
MFISSNKLINYKIVLAINSKQRPQHVHRLIKIYYYKDKLIIVNVRRPKTQKNNLHTSLVQRTTDQKPSTKTSEITFQEKTYNQITSLDLGTIHSRSQYDDIWLQSDSPSQINHHQRAVSSPIFEYRGDKDS